MKIKLSILILLLICILLSCVSIHQDLSTESSCTLYDNTCIITRITFVNSKDKIKSISITSSNNMANGIFDISTVKKNDLQIVSLNKEHKVMDVFHYDLEKNTQWNNDNLSELHNINSVDSVLLLVIPLLSNDNENIANMFIYYHRNKSMINITIRSNNKYRFIDVSRKSLGRWILSNIENDHRYSFEVLGDENIFVFTN